jgi:hypothetical protein
MTFDSPAHAAASDDWRAIYETLWENPTWAKPYIDELYKANLATGDVDGRKLAVEAAHDDMHAGDPRISQDNRIWADLDYEASYSPFKPPNPTKSSSPALPETELCFGEVVSPDSDLCKLKREKDSEFKKSQTQWHQIFDTDPH